MDAETIAMLIEWGPLAVMGVIFLIGFLFGVIRGSYKVMRRLLYVILFVGCSFFFIDTITKSFLDFNVTINGVQGVRKYIMQSIESSEDVKTFFRYAPELRNLIIDAPEIIVSPILFMILVFIVLPLSFPLYWIYLIIFNFIAKHIFNRRKYEVDENGNILRNEKGKKIKVVRKKHRLLGGLLRGAQGVFLFSIILLPVNLVNRIYTKAKEQADLKAGETLCSTNDSTKGLYDICGYLDIYGESIVGKLGGEDSLDKLINDRLTTIKYNGKELNLENELSSIAITAVLLNESGIMQLFANGEFNLETADFSVIKFDKLELMIDYLFGSTVVNEITKGGIDYVLHEVAADKLVEALKDDDIVSKLEYTNSAEIKQELKDIINILKYAVEENIVDGIVGSDNDPVVMLNSVTPENVEALLNKLLSLKILNRAMPSVIAAYGESLGIQAPDIMTDELNEEVATLFSQTVKVVQTLELANKDALMEGDMVENIANALFENGAIKTATKDDLATLLNDINTSYLFKNVLSTQINKLLEGKDYKVDARVLKYVENKDAWLKELSVLESAYTLYDEYNQDEVINYENITNLLNKISGTKVMLSVLPFAYDEILPQAGIEIDSEGLPVINFDGTDEDDTKKAFYDTWEAELVVLKNIADAAGTLELQSPEGIDIDLLSDAAKVDALSTIMGEIYSSQMLKNPMVDFMKDILNEFVVDFNVEFTAEELLTINTKEKWKNEFTNINEVLSIDLADEENVTGENLDDIFTAIGSMELFKAKKVQLLKYAVESSNFLTSEELESIEWPNTTNQTEIDAFWDNETSVLVNIVDNKDDIENMATMTVETMDTDKIGGIVNEVMTSQILSPIVVNKIATLLVENDVKDDRDSGTSTENLKTSIRFVSDWTEELALIKETVVTSGDITEDNMGHVATGESKNTVEKLFANIEASELLSNARANLMLKAVETINITEIPGDVTVSSLRSDGLYTSYNNEKSVIIEVSKNKSVFDDFATMSFETIDTDKVGSLLNVVKDSDLFGDYVVEEVKKAFVANNVNDDRDYELDTKDNLEASIEGVADWKAELAIIKSLLNVDGSSFSEKVNGVTKIETMLNNIETSELLANTRANLLIRAIESINIDGVRIPASVNVGTLRANAYEQYNKEKAVFITFAENRTNIDGMSDITALDSLDARKSMGSVLDAMKTSLILEEKYMSTIESALSTIKSNPDLSKYGVSFNSNYKDVVWSTTYESDGVRVKKLGEIDNLMVIKGNIASVAGYLPADLLDPDNKTEVISTVGATLDSVSASMLLGEDQADKIADKVIDTLTAGIIQNVTKDANKTWSQVFTEALN